MLTEVIIFYRTGYETAVQLNLWGFGSNLTTPILIPSNSMELKTKPGLIVFPLLPKGGLKLQMQLVSFLKQESMGELLHTVILLLNLLHG